jgi:hypothetical protein
LVFLFLLYCTLLAGAIAFGQVANIFATPAQRVLLSSSRTVSKALAGWAVGRFAGNPRALLRIAQVSFGLALVISSLGIFFPVFVPWLCLAREAAMSFATQALDNWTVSVGLPFGSVKALYGLVATGINMAIRSWVSPQTAAAAIGFSVGCTALALVVSTKLSAAPKGKGTSTPKSTTAVSNKAFSTCLVAVLLGVAVNAVGETFMETLATQHGYISIIDGVPFPAPGPLYQAWCAGMLPVQGVAVLGMVYPKIRPEPSAGRMQAALRFCMLACGACLWLVQWQPQAGLFGAALFSALLNSWGLNAVSQKMRSEGSGQLIVPVYSLLSPAVQLLVQLLLAPIAGSSAFAVIGCLALVAGFVRLPSLLGLVPKVAAWRICWALGKAPSLTDPTPQPGEFCGFNQSQGNTMANNMDNMAPPERL